MSTIRDFEDLEIWKKARELAKNIYQISNQREFRKDFELRGQIRRASTSAMSNIAEGFERGGNREFVRFLSIAKGSVSEVRSQLYVALDQDYLTRDSFERLRAFTIQLANMIGALVRYLKTTKKGRTQGCHS